MTHGLEALFALLFIVLLVLGTGRTIYRLLEYRRASVPVPLILWRDVFSRTGLTVPFALILVVRALGLQPFVAGQTWWIVLTSVPAIFSVGVYAYFEYFIIDKRTHVFGRRREDQG